MIIFEDEFRRSNGTPISYGGHTVVMFDQFPVPIGRARLAFRFVSTNSEWKQGFKLTVDGSFLINQLVVKKVAVLWEDTAPPEAEFECESQSGIISVTNVWDFGNGVTQAWHAGAAMIVEQIKRGRRYRCNDGHLDDDFDDLIFELTSVSD